MKYFILLTLLFTINFSASAQSNDLIKQGVDLHNKGKYTEAIDKFNEVLKTDPENPYANYEVAFSLYAAKRAKEATPYLDKAVRSDNKSLSVAAYCLQASIYDEANDHKKAIEIYNTAIQINPDYPQIYYNLAIAQFGNRDYADAENSAIEAIKKNPKHPGSQRLYALVTFHQNKRANALLGLCSFLLLEPTGPRAAEAYGNIQHIIQGGVLTDDKGKNTIVLSATDQKETNTLNLGISMAVLSAKTKNLKGIDLFKSIFALIGELSAKKTDKSFFDNFFAAYFYKLSQSNNMPAFTHTITLTDKTIDNAKWAKEHTDQITAMSEWLKSTERKF
ncbi:MAG: tetratricopeptide repeat protein [Mucilaginibacter sp.]|uniref:tetratricopeptide repeat protein n=1 Tax=Mucilaginibacter sp. TaxID=1882438 RepID=UPI003263FC1B